MMFTGVCWHPDYVAVTADFMRLLVDATAHAVKLR